MKLGKKISLICGAVLICAVAICSLLQLMWTQKRLEAQTLDHLLRKQGDLASAFLMDFEQSREAGDSLVVRNVLARYCFSKHADSGGILIFDGEVLENKQNFDPRDYLPMGEEDDQRHFRGKINGEEMLLVGSSLYISYETRAQVYVAEDMTPVLEQVAAMARRFAGIGLIATALGLGCILILVNRSLQSLEALQAAAAQIAGGSYEKRAKVETRDEVGALAQSFNHMADRVEAHIGELTETAQRQKRFIGAVTHEFKTPLTGILLNVDTLLTLYLTEEEQREALEHIQSQAKWLESLVKKLLHLVTMGEELKCSPVDVEELLEKVERTTAGTLNARGVKLKTECFTDTVSGDEDLLLSVLINLVDNAAKASKPGGTVYVTAHGRFLEVADQGIGIPPEALPHVTEAFYMADPSRSKAQGGVGLGLSLVREILDAHGAIMEIESVPGGGTTVRIKFPA